MVEFGELTIIIDIEPAGLEELRSLLNTIGGDVSQNDFFDFSVLTTAHFVRWVILDQSNDIHGKSIPAALAFGADFDGPADKFLNDFVVVAQTGLDTIYQRCVGYPGANKPAELVAYLLSHNVKSAAYYAGYRGRSLEQVNNESGLRSAIEAFVNKNTRNFKAKSAKEVLAEIQTFIFSSSTGQFNWAKTPYVPYRGSLIDGLSVSIGLVVLLYAALLIKGRAHLAILLAPIYIIFALIVTLRIKEADDKQSTAVPDPQYVSELLAEEDQRSVVQNQLTHIVNIKSGLFRLLTLRFVLFSINWLATNLFYQGDLGGIPSIHFARWAIINNGRRLLFYSNFDGSWENYLGDFIDRAHAGLTGVWSNTEGFPKSSFLINDGATNEELFKNWTRNHQIPTQVWYSASPALTVENIINNTAIRTGLLQDASGDADAWTTLI
jgi:hypothetical protein